MVGLGILMFLFFFTMALWMVIFLSSFVGYWLTHTGLRAIGIDFFGDDKEETEADASEA